MPGNVLYDFDFKYIAKGLTVVGIDEAGRGPLAGPVVVAACALDHNTRFEAIDDSKKLTAKIRDQLYEEITGSAISWACEIISVETIDSMNILQATLHGMFVSAGNLGIKNAVYLVDGNRPVKGLTPQVQIVKGDSQSASIAAASIIAKVTRDRYMKELHENYPHYGFEHNFGYSTREHILALEEYGPTPHHRKSFEPVRRAIERKAGYDLFKQYTD